MVKGLVLFKDHFHDYLDQFVLIGGTACDIVMNDAGLDFRATKDLDIVLKVEVLNVNFIKAFWNFIAKGKYKNHQKSTGKRLFYRFFEPEENNYPYMIELFSRIPDSINLKGQGHLTPIPTTEDLSSLSAILLDDDYYNFLHEGKEINNGLPIVRPEHLIPLKIRAWLDLNQRKSQGEAIDSRNIKKHKNDVFRLYQIIDPEYSISLPEKVKDDIFDFLEKMKITDIDLSNLGLKNQNKDRILTDLQNYYK